MAFRVCFGDSRAAEILDALKGERAAAWRFAGAARKPALFPKRDDPHPALRATLSRWERGRRACLA